MEFKLNFNSPMFSKSEYYVESVEKKKQYKILNKNSLSKKYFDYYKPLEVRAAVPAGGTLAARAGGLRSP